MAHQLAVLQRRIVARPELLLIASLLAASMLLFVVGVVVERNAVGGETGREVPCVQQQTGESGDSDKGVGEHHPAACTQQAEAQHGETVLGVQIDNPGIVAAVAVGWLALIVGLFRFGRPALPVVALAAGGALVFDIAEVARQIGEGRGGVAFLAVLVALGHVAVALLALLVLAGYTERITAVLRRVSPRRTN